MLFDRHFSLDTHSAAALSRAQRRQEILSHVAHSSWGLESSVLRLTHDALVYSLMRYGLLVVRPCGPDDLINKMDTMILRTASRRISGLPMSTRIESLPCISGPRPFRNLYVRQRSVFLHSALLAHDSGMLEAIRRELCAIMKVDTLELRPACIPFDIAAAFVEDTSGVPSRTQGAPEWMCNAHAGPLDLSGVPQSWKCVLCECPGDSPLRHTETADVHFCGNPLVA